ncbi:MAG: thiol-disulfide oxidoreductase DCC family protein [Phycisphaerales bacterium JB060]
MPEACHSHPIVLFDGDCGFCDRTVRLLDRLDTRDRLRFAPLDSQAAVYLFQKHDVPESIDSIVLVHADGSEGRARVESDAAIGVARLLGFPWSLAVVLKIIPRPIRDAAYRLIARHRYRLFGRVQACGLPSEAQRRKLLQTRADVEGALAGHAER